MITYIAIKNLLLLLRTLSTFAIDIDTPLSNSGVKTFAGTVCLRNYSKTYGNTNSNRWTWTHTLEFGLSQVHLWLWSISPCKCGFVCTWIFATLKKVSYHISRGSSSGPFLSCILQSQPAESFIHMQWKLLDFGESGETIFSGNTASLSRFNVFFLLNAWKMSSRKW